MDERLKGMSILIGKEPKICNLCLAFEWNGVHKMITLGEKGSVPNTVSRCKPTEKVAHCKLDIDQKGNMVLHNLKPQNVTLVNSIEIQSKRIELDSQVILGAGKYQLDIKNVIAALSKALATVPKPPQEFSIVHLEKVWNIYHDKLLLIRKRQKNVGLLRSIPVLFSMSGGLVTALVGPEYRIIPLCFTVLAVIVMIYGFYKSLTDKSIEETERLTEDFQNRYVCPNPECQHFMGNQPYNVIRKNKACPYCRCKYTDH